MSITVPDGGFFAAFEPADDLRAQVLQNLRAAGMDAGEIGPVVFGARRQFEGQGLWSTGGGGVVYDLDLTDVSALERIVGHPGGSGDPGALLWRLYREHGLAWVDSLRGAFAFAVWDADRRRFAAVTDPYGIRPVVYAGLREGLVVASRIRHALLHPGVERALDPNAIHQYLFFSAIPTPLTVYKGVRKLAPGHLLEWNGRRGLEQTYYDIRYRPDSTVGEGYWKRAIPMEVRRAVARSSSGLDPERTGCFLSGGTDSSSIAGLYGRIHDRPANTFSIGFDEPGYNELEYAHIAARRFGTRQTDYFVTPDDVLALIDKLPEIYDEPFGNSSVIPTFYCAKVGREAGMAVMLAGDGGDEIFGGNERYVHDLVFARYGLLPAFLRKTILEPLLRAMPSVGPVHKAKRYVRRANIPHPDRFYSYNLLAEEPLERIFRPEVLEQIDPDGFLALARRHYRRAAPADVTDRLLYLDMKFTITDNDLRKVTQMTEAAGVRVRYPLLDRELVDFAATIPPWLKIKPRRERYIFKEAMKGVLPDEILAKEKHGFGLPVGPWFRKHERLAGVLSDTLFAPEARILEWVRPGFLAELKKSFETGQNGYYGANLWAFLIMELWLQKNAPARGAKVVSA